MRLTRRRITGGTAVLAALAMTVVPAAAQAAPTAPAGFVDTADADALRKASTAPGAIVAVKDGDSVEGFGSGTTRLGADEALTADTQLRVASNTKTYVATVLLQLVEEGQLELDAPIGRYLPGLVKGEGIDENAITVRQLMQHRSGLADISDVMWDPSLQVAPPTPEKMIAIGLRKGAQFEPGADWKYSNTGYTILGVLIEELTGKRLAEVFDERIITPLGLEETRYAHAGDKRIEGPHARGYVGVPVLWGDLTGYEPGVFSHAGALISSGSDMTVFEDALVSGKLVGKAMLAEMQKTVGDHPYGLGLYKLDVSCGTVWGHDGLLPGYRSMSFADGKGKAVFTAFNATNVDKPLTDIDPEALRIVESAICGTDAAGSTAQLPETAAAERPAPAQLERLREAAR